MIFFLYHKIKLCYKGHVHYTPFTCDKKTFKILEMLNRFLIFFKFQISKISNCEYFLNVTTQLTSSQVFSHQNFIIKKKI
jgi:hypothetical protein